jgi:O-antigen ligase
MILTYVWRFQALFPFLALLQIPIAASLGAYLLYMLDRDRRRALGQLKHPVTLLMLGLFFIMVLSIPTSLWPGGSFRFLFPHLTLTFIFAFLVAASIRGFADVERLVGVHVFGAAVYAFIVILYSGLGNADRSAGFGGYDANDYAMHLVIAFPMAAYVLSRARTWARRGLIGLAMLLVAAAIILSGSRGGFLGFLVVVGYLVLLFRALPGRLRVGAVVLVTLVAGLVASDQYWERMATLLNPTQDYNWAGQSSTGRFEVWKRGIGYMLERPLLGVGVGRFGSAEGRLSQEGADRRSRSAGWKWSSPHNSFVEIGAELGVLGLVVFLAMFGSAFRTLRGFGRAPPRAMANSAAPRAITQALLGALLGYVSTAFFLSHGYAAVLYALLALVAGLGKFQRLSGRSQPVRSRVATQPGTRTPGPPVLLDRRPRGV